MEIISQSFTIAANSSKSAVEFGVVVSVRGADYGSATLVIGSPGLPNAVKKLELGDAVLYETVGVGLAEVRVTGLQPGYAEVLITKVSPRLGITAGFEADGGQNSSFSLDERSQIRGSLASVLEHVSKRSDVSPEQLELLSRKLDEIAAAAERLGRKDWIMFVAGTLTNVVVGAAFSPEAAKVLFTSANGALGWVFQNSLRLLGL